MNVGEIEYTVSVETKKSIDSALKVTQSLNKTESQMKSTGSASSKLGTQMNKLSSDIKRANSASAATERQFSSMGKVIGTIIGAMATKVIIQMADDFTEMSSRLKQVAADTDEYEKVQARLLQTANNTYRPLAEAAEVYIRTSKAVKDLGYNTDQVLDITDSFSYLLVTNAASSDRASSAINAYSKAIQTGKISSETWQSILAAMPSVVEDIASATGSTESAIRQLGIEGKLSLEALNEALLRSKDKNLELADAMDTTVGDAVVAFRNSLQVFIGKVNESSGATNSMVGSIESMSEALQDPATIRAAQELAAGVITAFTTMIEFLRETVAVVEWAAESMAAAMHGPALDDVVRMTDEIENLEQQAKNTREEMDKMRLLRINPFKSDAEYQAHYDELLRKIAFYKKAVEDAQSVSLPPPASDDKAQSKPQASDAVNATAATAIRKTTTARKQLTEAEREAIKAAEDLKRGNESNTETLENLRESIYQAELTGRDLVERQAELSLNKYATPEQIAEVKALAAQLKNAQDQADRTKSLQVQAKSLDREGSAQEAYQKELTDLQEMLDLKMITEDEYRQYTLDSETSLQQRLMELDEERYRSQSAAHDLLIGSLDSIGSHATDAFMDFATGAKTGTDAVMAMGQAIGQSVIRAMVDMGVQMAVNAVKEKIFASQSAATAAATGAAITAAYTPAAAAASVATLGGAAVAGLSSMAMAVPAMMSMFAVGSRRQGGPVAAGSMYRVNEGGAPEIFQNNLGQQYMMPNSRGEVISNKDASKGGGAGGTIVNVYEAENTRADVTTTKDEQGRDVIDIVLQNLLSDGELAGAVGRITGTQYQGV